MIIDLRDYTTTLEGRDPLIERCQSLLFPEQELLGATFAGIFRDADDARRFVFLRAMPDMATRQRVLTAFYSDGEMWREHRDQVNGWLVDSDNVLLLRPVSEWLPPATGPSVVGMYSRVGKEPLAIAAAAALRREVEAAVAAAGGRMLVTFQVDPVANNYPRHPIREGEQGLVWLATFAAYQPLGLATVEQRRLLPTEKSRLR